MARMKLTPEDKDTILRAFKARFPAIAAATLINKGRHKRDYVSISAVHYQYSLLKAGGIEQLSYTELVDRIFDGEVANEAR